MTAWEGLKLWEEGTTREQRIKYRLDEDRIRGLLWEDKPQLLKFTDWCEERREQLEMAKATGRPKKRNAQADKLVTALTFISAASKDTKQGLYQKHIHIGGQMAVAFDGVLAAGHPIDEDFVAFPNLEQLRAALETCGKQLSLTLGDGTIEVKGENVHAVVQCLPAADMHLTVPDPNGWQLDDVIKAAFEACIRYTREGGTKVHESAILLGANTCIGTNGSALIEYWHGVNLPDMILPRAFCHAVMKTKAKLVGFGWGDGRSVTFWFEDGSWIKSQLYAEGFPMNARTIMDVQATLSPVAPDFVKAIEAVVAFSDDGTVTLEAGQIIGGSDSGPAGAAYDVKDMKVAGKRRYNASFILKVADLIQTIDIDTDPARLIWYGDKVRGIIAAYNA